MLRLLRQLSLAYLRASWGRTALVVGGIATGVALIVAIDAINASVLHNFRRTMLSSILERRRELSLWGMIGADTRSIRRSIVIESGTIGLCGITLGIALGIVTAWIWVYLDFYFAWSSAVWFFVLVSLTTVAAGRLAATRAARQSILDGLSVD